MEIILLERIAKLGQMGEVVRVKEGYARNFLLPQGKALRATPDNKAKFEGMKAQLEATNLKLKGDAQKVAEKLDGQSFVVLRQASDVGQLFGSVTTRDVAALLTEGGFTVTRNQINLNAPIKTIGRHVVPIALHPEIETHININVARSADEAERLARGEDITISREATEAEEAEIAAEAFFENPQEPDEEADGSEASETPAKAE
jgi:large subunit ribosomal protein L9